MSYASLATHLGTSQRQLRRWREVDGAPAGEDVGEWEKFLAERRAERKLAREHEIDPANNLDPDLPGECAYDRAVQKSKLTYTQAKLREQVIGETIANQTRHQELAVSRGELVTKQDAEKACAKVRDAMERRFELTVVSVVKALGITGISAEVRQSISDELEKAWDVTGNG